jgi:hypothetical protein
MKLPAYLTALGLEKLALDYPWENSIADDIWATNDDDNPRLASALELISAKSAFALGIAASEWVVARVFGHADTDDALLRIEAAWAAVLDRRYAMLPSPAKSAPSQVAAFAGPLRLSMSLLAEAFEQFHGSGEEESSLTQAQITLVDHIAGRHAAFQPWLTESLRRCHAHFPRVDVPVEKQEPVPLEFFDPAFAWKKGSGKSSLERFVQSLNPSANAYLQSAKKMVAAGYRGQPYGTSP